MQFTSLSGYWGTLLVLLYFVVAAYAAVAVYRDAQRKGHELFLGLHPIWWAAMTLIGSITGVVAYWALHYSNLRQSSNHDQKVD
jgi:hypothetical protein